MTLTECKANITRVDTATGKSSTRPCAAEAVAVVSYGCAGEHIATEIPWCTTHLSKASYGRLACARCAAAGVVNPVRVFELLEP